jgi:hypothetical protein
LNYFERKCDLGMVKDESYQRSEFVEKPVREELVVVAWHYLEMGRECGVRFQV